MFINVLTIAGVLTAGIGGAWRQNPPTAPPTPPPPVSQTTPPQTSASETPQVPAPGVPAATPAAVPAPRPLTDSELRHRLDAIYLFEGVLMNAVKLAAQTTAGEIRRIEPGIVMFSSAPVRAHGTYLEGYGVFFQVEIPSVIPSVASLVEQIARGERMRPNTSPAQPTALTGSTREALMDPDAHYVAAVKDRVIDAMIRHSNSMELRADEWLTVAARDGSEVPGQLAQPSTMILRIKGSDLSDFFAGRIDIEQARKLVQVRGF
jgi:hypothetical protein